MGITTATVPTVARSGIALGGDRDLTPEIPGQGGATALKIPWPGRTRAADGLECQFEVGVVWPPVGQLYDEPITPDTDEHGRLRGYHWRGRRYVVGAVVKTYPAEPAGEDTRVVRVRVHPDGAADGIAELARGTGGWRLRHLFLP